jgi:hypothetical protein
MGEGKHLCPSFDPSRRGLYLVVIIGGENRLSRTKFVSNVKQSFNIVDGGNKTRILFISQSWSVPIRYQGFLISF